MKYEKLRKGKVVWIQGLSKAKVLDDLGNSIVCDVLEGCCRRKDCPFCYGGRLTYDRSLVKLEKYMKDKKI